MNLISHINMADGALMSILKRATKAAGESGTGLRIKPLKKPEVSSPLLTNNWLF